MNDEIKMQLQEIVTKSLPQMEVEALRNRLEEADIMEDKLKEQDQLLEEHRVSAANDKKQINELSNELNELLRTRDSLIKREQEVTAKELACETRERNMELTLLQQKVSLIEASRKDIFKLTDSVFRNKTVSETVHLSKYMETQSVPDGMGGYRQEIIGNNGHEDKTTTRTVVQSDGELPSDLTKTKSDDQPEG